MEVYTKERAAELIGIQVRALNNWMRDGRIRFAVVTHNNRRKVAIPRSEVERFLSAGTPQTVDVDDNFTFIR